MHVTKWYWLRQPDSQIIYSPRIICSIIWICRQILTFKWHHLWVKVNHRNKWHRQTSIWALSSNLRSWTPLCTSKITLICRQTPSKRRPTFRSYLVAKMMALLRSPWNWCTLSQASQTITLRTSATCTSWTPWTQTFSRHNRLAH